MTRAIENYAPADGIIFFSSMQLRIIHLSSIIISTTGNNHQSRVPHTFHLIHPSAFLHQSTY